MLQEIQCSQASKYKCTQCEIEEIVWAEGERKIMPPPLFLALRSLYANGNAQGCNAEVLRA